jgi:HD-GYP domain-containing protein (c-di-GMP phosphodiesterase class II)
MSTAATSTTPVYDVAGDEIVREARQRVKRNRIERVRQQTFAALGAVAAAGAVATALTIHQGPAFSILTGLVFVVSYTVACGIRFEAGSGLALPTELVFVPMLFAVPIGLVPALVGTSFFCAMGYLPMKHRDLSRISPLLTNAGYTLGPVAVIAIGGGLPLRWSAWPIYLVALAAQFLGDFAFSAIGEMWDLSPRTVAEFSMIVWAVDLALAPIGLLVAFATHDHPALVVLVLPLMLLFRTFAQERKRRIDHALELSDAYRGTAFLLGDVVEADDAYTGSHSRHVVDLVLGVSDRMGLKGSDRRDAEFVALLHDVGKIKIPAEIINKPGALTPEERAVIETHTVEGQQMLEQVGGLLGHVGDVVRSCHERWDGQGYPDGLAGPEIPLIARIVCACDAYSAMTTDRSYRKARTKDEALDELERCTGSHFDPAVVAALVTVETAAG